MKLLQQDKDYNCGAYSLHFLFFMNGISYDVTKLENELNVTEENGTSHEDILRVIINNNINFSVGCGTNISELERKTPAIVNYQYCDQDGCDGHYSVVLNVTSEIVCLYNPAIGEIENISVDLFKQNWYSERYGKQWFLSIKK